MRFFNFWSASSASMRNFKFLSAVTVSLLISLLININTVDAQRGIEVRAKL